MFRKPLPVTGTHKLGGSDVKRLKKELEVVNQAISDVESQIIPTDQ